MEELHNSDDVQKIWNYLGRNRVTTVSEIYMITDIDPGEIETICDELVTFGYMEKMNDKRSDHYKCIRHTGKHAPSIIGNGVIMKAVDTNTRQDIAHNGDPPTEYKIIREILSDPGRDWSVLELMRSTNQSKGAIEKALRYLVDHKVLTEKGVHKKQIRFGLTDAVSVFHNLMDFRR